MKKILTIIIVLLIVAGGAWALYYNYSKTKSDIATYETVQPFRTDIQKTSVATGEVKPREKIEIKPNISGVIQKIAVEEGERVKDGQLIASIKVIPSVGNLNSAKQQISSAEIDLQNQTRTYNRQKKLFDQGVISRAEYDGALATYNTAKQNLRAAKNNYQVAQTGIAPGLEQYATTQIRSTIDGMVLDIPVEIGNTVQEINNFSVGTTIATVANVNDMIFEGKVDEADVGKLSEGMPIKVTIGALPNQEFDGELYFIAPSGTEENGIVQFEIRAKVNLKDDIFLRAGYSANALITTENEENTLVIREADLQYDDNNQAYVEVKNGDGWDRKNIRLGISDGVNVQVLGGINENDEIKVWNTDLNKNTDNEVIEETTETNE